VREAGGKARAYVYSRESDTEALQAKMLTKDEAGRLAVNIARLPELLKVAKPCRASDPFQSGLRPAHLIRTPHL
jgi:hypothetical protein